MFSSILFAHPIEGQTSNVQSVNLPTGVTPNITLETEAYLSFRPNPVGLGQSVLVNVWLHPPIYVGRAFKDAFFVTITDPDGDKETIGPMDSFAGDSTAWFEFNPDKLGSWKLKFDFLGQYFPNGTTPRSMFWAYDYIGSAYYKPSTTGEVELIVQEDMVAAWPPVSLPTDYWTRPVHPENREWWPILGNYPATGILGGGQYWPEDTNKHISNYNFVPYVQGPNTPHIVWKRQGSMGGLIGGSAGQITDVLFAGTGVIGFPSIIYNGRTYMTVSKVSQTGTGSQNYWQCYDIRTGQLYWERPLYPGETAPTIIEYEEGNTEVEGADARVGITVYLTALISPTSSSAGRIVKYSPWTGAVLVNITGPPSGVGAATLYEYPNCYSVQNLGGGRYRLIQWTIENDAGQISYSAYGTPPIIDNFTARVISNVSYPFSSLGTCDFDAGVAVSTAGILSMDTGTNIGHRIMGADLKTGQLLWNVTTDLSTGLETFFSTGIGRSDHGKYACRMNDGHWYAWDLRTGQLAWKSEISSWPWGAFGAYSVESAYGLIFSRDYAGVHAINWTNGNIEWTFEATTPYVYETPYDGQYAFHGAGMVADGKLYTFSVEHSPSQPITRGDRMYCLDAKTGEMIWNITLGQGAPGSRAFQGAIADGYLAHTDEYNGYMYVFGKGQSATTVSVPQTAITKGTSAIISGTVLDMSPAQPNTPCIGEESISQWMEHIHMQKAIPSNVVGVPVSIDSVDPNGNAVHIADVVSDMSGTYFYTWTPEIPGDYAITATFMGDDSYGSSWAETHATVTETPAASPTATPINLDSINNNIMMGFIGVGIGIIIAIVLAVLLLRKRP